MNILVLIEVKVVVLIEWSYMSSSIMWRMN